ncbi:hypothetical protein ACHAWF_004144 [Thalassiosira exigua]
MATNLSFRFRARPPPRLRALLSAGALLCSAAFASQALLAWRDDGDGGIPRGVLRGDGPRTADSTTARRMLAEASGNDDEDDFFDVPSSYVEAGDDPSVVPVPPPLHAALSDDAIAPKDPPVPPYSLDDVLLSSKQYHHSFAVLVYDPSSDMFVMHYSKWMDWTASCKKLVKSLETLSHSLRTMFPERFDPSQPELILAVSSSDYPALKRRHYSAAPWKEDMAPVLHFGSVFRRPILPQLIAMPMPQTNHLSCFDEWASHNSVCGSWKARVPGKFQGLVFGKEFGLKWNDLIPQVVWRGTDFSYLTKIGRRLHRPDMKYTLDRVVATYDPEEVEADPKGAAVRALWNAYDRLLPRWKGVAWTAEAELEAAKATELDDDNGQTELRVHDSGEGESRQTRLDTRISRYLMRKKALNRRQARKARRGRRRRLEEESQPTEGRPVPWANIKFYSTMHQGTKARALEVEYYQKFMERGIPAAGNYMSLDQLGQHKYQIDIGGGGGTTWSGTLEKLGLPGLLFHHVTPTKDYLHDLMVPWVHYVPVRADLSDLREKYEWAESHPQQARQISDNATELARNLGTPEGVQALYKHFYEGRLRDAVQAYAPLEEGGAWRKALAEASFRPIFRCNGNHLYGCARLTDKLNFRGHNMPLAKEFCTTCSG